MKPGEYLLEAAPIEANVGRKTVNVVVTHTGDRPVQIGSHYHFFEVNNALLSRARVYVLKHMTRSTAAEIDRPLELNQIGQALITLTLEMMLGRPKGIITQLVHFLGHIAGRPKYLAEPLVRIPAVVCRRALQADVVQFDLADIECMKSFDHRIG